MNSFKELLVWQKSRELVSALYLTTNSLPESEKFGLTSQSRRAAVSIPSNIAEGYRRKNRKEYVYFLSISAGSAAELETQLILINDIFKTDVTNLLKTLDEIQKMLSSLINKLDPKA